MMMMAVGESKLAYEDGWERETGLANRERHRKLTAYMTWLDIRWVINLITLCKQKHLSWQPWLFAAIIYPPGNSSIVYIEVRRQR